MKVCGFAFAGNHVAHTEPAFLAGFRRDNFARDSSADSETTTLRCRPPIPCEETKLHNGAGPTTWRILRLKWPRISRCGQYKNKTNSRSLHPLVTGITAYGRC